MAQEEYKSLGRFVTHMEHLQRNIQNVVVVSYTSRIVDDGWFICILQISESTSRVSIILRVEAPLPGLMEMRKQDIHNFKVDTSEGIG